ncbi:GNAT family N-acetyltransferase [Lusitaniella coriacea]|uniref:GNAT family N-acetyltransferase n=1 Tax=Lusitaniella coriacea TaxID=1983105 RepID=UPI003CEC5295
MTQNLTIREANNNENKIIAQHFSQLWRDNNVSKDCIQSNWREMTDEFIENARKELQFKAFIAEIDRAIVGSTSCQRFAGLYPIVLTPQHRLYGYIWNVYVEPEFRDRGIGKKLTQTACEYLKSIGCTQAILHASPYGKPLYEKLGFVASNEMRLDL